MVGKPQVLALALGVSFRVLGLWSRAAGTSSIRLANRGVGQERARRPAAAPNPEPSVPATPIDDSRPASQAGG